MKTALEELGYKNVYHFTVVDEDPAHTDLWIEALRREYDPRISHSTKDLRINWNQLLGNCQVRISQLAHRY
jgi:hypothetical protein